MLTDNQITGIFLLIVLFFLFRWFFRKRKVKRRKFTAQEYMVVAERDGAKCRKCGSRERLSLDHIIPISKGGKYILRNYQILCRKGNKT